MERKEALELLKKEIKNQNLIKHSLAVEAAMKDLAEKFDQDKEKWGICGLLHDIDYEKTKNAPDLHSKTGSDFLKNLGLEEEVCQAILTHNQIHGLEPKSKMAKALFCLDPLTGLIVAATLVLPSKKIKELKTENIINRFGEKSFAKGANREIIGKCQDYLNLKLEEFVEICLFSMQKIAYQLDLE